MSVGMSVFQKWEKKVSGTIRHQCFFVFLHLLSYIIINSSSTIVIPQISPSHHVIVVQCCDLSTVPKRGLARDLNGTDGAAVHPITLLNAAGASGSSMSPSTCDII